MPAEGYLVLSKVPRLDYTLSNVPNKEILKAGGPLPFGTLTKKAKCPLLCDSMWGTGGTTLSFGGLVVGVMGFHECYRGPLPLQHPQPKPSHPLPSHLPSFLQVEPWKTHIWQDGKLRPRRREIRLRVLVK